MLCAVTVKLGGLLGERRDREASDLVAAHYNANASRAKASKYLIDRKAKPVKQVVAMAQRVRATAYKLTFPWEGSLRLLPAKAFDRFNNDIRSDILALEEAQHDYEAEYPALVRQSRRSQEGLGLMFDVNDYPPVEQIHGMWRQSVTYWPMPETGHFVADICQDAVNNARRTMEESTKLLTNHAVNDLVQRVESTVASYVTKLSAYNPPFGPEHNGPRISEPQGIFRDSLIDNVKTMGQLVRDLNFLNDPGLDLLATQLERLANYSADALRENHHLREGMANKGRDLIASLDRLKRVDGEVGALISSISDYNL